MKTAIIILIEVLIPFISIAQDNKNKIADSISDTRYMQLIDSSFIAGDGAKYEKAIEYLQRAISIDKDNPMNVMLLNNIAGIYQLLGKYDDALLNYSAALSQNPDQETIRYNRALLEAKTGKNKAAITDYSLLIAQRSKNQLYRYQRAMVYIILREYDLAENDLRYIIAEDKTSLKAKEGYALLETMRGNYNKAERLYNYIIEKLPNYSNAYEGRARMFLASGMAGFALRDTNKALEVSKNKPSAELFTLRAEIFTALGDKENAKISEHKAEALRNSPNRVR